MKKIFKWVSIITGSLLVLVVGILLIIPFFVNVQIFKPEIEGNISRIINRPFVIGGKLKLSLFPWAGLALSDIHVGNPPGFEEKDFVYIKSFDVSMKLIPLLFREVKVKRFVVNGARVILEKGKAGTGNWEKRGEDGGKAHPGSNDEGYVRGKEKGGGNLPLKALAVGEFAVTDSSVLWIDHGTGLRKEISKIDMTCHDISLDRPVKFHISALIDNRPFSLAGEFGPLGLDPGRKTIPFSLRAQALKELKMQLKGKVAKIADQPRFNFLVNIYPFSPERVWAGLGKSFPVTTTDPAALKRVSINASVKGSPQSISVTDGSLLLDESKIAFSVEARDLKRPDVSFDVNIDKINVDRYLPLSNKRESSPAGKMEVVGTTGKTAGKSEQVGYPAARNILLKGDLSIGNLVVHGARLQDISIKIVGRNGLFRLEPVTLNAYNGNIRARINVNLSGNTPKSNVVINAAGLKLRPLFKEMLGKDLLEGTAGLDAEFKMIGDTPEEILPALNGKGEALLKDGAILGIDLPGMIQNVKAAFGHAEKRGLRSKTEFSELKSVFTVTHGIFNTQKTTLVSSRLHVVASGKADLVKQTLDFRVAPIYYGRTEQEEGEKRHRTIAVPVLVTGSFSSPEFRPDLEGAIKKGVEKVLSDQSRLDKLLDKNIGKKDRKKLLKDTVRDLLNGFISGDQQ